MQIKAINNEYTIPALRKSVSTNKHYKNSVTPKEKEFSNPKSSIIS
jgi:hypothetical protein